MLTDRRERQYAANVMGYNLSRSQKTVTMQDLNCGQMRALPRLSFASVGVSGCKNHYKFVLLAGTKAKSVPLFHKKSGKQLTHIVRVICRVNFKIVRMCKSFAVQSLISQCPCLRVGAVNSISDCLNEMCRLMDARNYPRSE